MLVLFRDCPKINQYPVFLEWFTSAPAMMVCWGSTTCLYHRTSSVGRQLLTVGCGVGLSSQSTGESSWRCLYCLLLIFLSSHLFSAWLVFVVIFPSYTCSDTPPSFEILHAEIKGMVELKKIQKRIIKVCHWKCESTSYEERLCRSGLSQSGKKSKMYKAVRRSLRSNSFLFVWWKDQGADLAAGVNAAAVQMWGSPFWMPMSLEELMTSKWSYGQELVPWELAFGCGSEKLGASRSCSLNRGSWPMLAGKAASAFQRKGFHESGPMIQLFCFVWYTSKMVPSGAKQKLLICASNGVFFCDCHLLLWRWAWQTVHWTLGLWPWLPGHKGSLF